MIRSFDPSASLPASLETMGLPSSLSFFAKASIYAILLRQGLPAVHFGQAGYEGTSYDGQDEEQVGGQAVQVMIRLPPIRLRSG